MKIEQIDTWEQTKHKAQQIIETLLVQTDLFEMRNRVKPTVFMSYDLFAIIVAATGDLVIYRVDKTQTGHTICGYDIELIHHGSNLLYVGYKVDVGGY